MLIRKIFKQDHLKKKQNQEEKMYKLKIRVFVILILLFITQLVAQDRSLKESDKINNFYLDIVGKMAYIDCDPAIIQGLRFGYNINEKVSIGFSGSRLLSNEDESYVNYKREDKINLSQGGIESFYKCELSERFYVTAGMTIGVAKVEYKDKDGDDWFGLIEPRASTNYRITDCFGIGTSIDYRIASGVNFSDFSNSDFSGWSANLSLKFGF